MKSIIRFFQVAGPIILCGLVLASCRMAPVLNVENAPVNISKSDYSLADMKTAIIRAGAGLGWHIKEAEPGHLVGTLLLRTHMAQVDIRYTKKSYSIVYKDSKDLDYDGSKIHKNYNGWIQNLDNAIQNQLVAL